MLLFVTLGIFIILAMLLYISAKEDWNYVLCGVITFFVVAALASFLVMSGIVIAANINVDATLAESQERYDSLTYQLDNGLFEEGNSVARKQLYDQIQNWNEDLARGKKSKQNFWLSIFYAPIYDEFDFIRLPELKDN